MYDLNENRNIAYICVLYRAASFFMMMVFVYNGQFYPEYNAESIIFPLLGIASVISLTMYSQIKEAPVRVKVALEFETIFIFFIYLVTGGINSPVIWMITVPSIQFLFHFKRKYYVLYVLVLLGLTSLAGPYVTNEQINAESIAYLPNFILAVTMLLIISLLSRQYHNNDAIHKNLVDAEKKLENEKNANQVLNKWLIESCAFIGELLAEEDEERGIKKVLQFAHDAIPVKGVCLYRGQDKENAFYSSDDIKDIVDNADPAYSIKKYDIECTGHSAGLCIITEQDDDSPIRQNPHKIDLLLKITESFFERNALRQEIKTLLIKNEQKRIAEEIHDGVKQDIHGAGYLLYDVIKRFEQYPGEEIEEKLNIIYDAIKDAGQSLRKVIYSLDQSDDVQSWLLLFNTEVLKQSRLYGIPIEMNLDEAVRGIGSISISLFDALRRILKESVANSVERGGAQNIWLQIKRQEQYLHIIISDDGTGFGDLSSTHFGIGMRSLGRLTREHKGSMDYYNGAGSGAVVELRLMYKS